MGLFESLTLVFLLVIIPALLIKTVRDYRKWKSGRTLYIYEHDLPAVMKIMEEHKLSFEEAAIKFIKDRDQREEK